jgi:hypothetical protein
LRTEVEPGAVWVAPLPTKEKPMIGALGGIGIVGIIVLVIVVLVILYFVRRA